MAASILTAAYHILKDDGAVYQDLGGDYFDPRGPKKAAVAGAQTGPFQP